jgi:hypothetical protein
VARHALPMIAEINATAKKVNAIKNRSPPPESPPVRTHTSNVASAAIGNVNKKPKTTIMIKPMMTSMASIQSSEVKFVGTAICRSVEKPNLRHWRTRRF